jgi:mono/diheme cytochrome c family protein
MNTSKQINLMVGLLFVSLVGLTLYFIWDIDRAEQAIVRQEQTNVERGAHLFSLNCRSCHGLKGEGVIERGGLPGAPLNVAVNRPPELSGGALEAQMKRFHDTITCGRVGTVMPPWSVEQGGALNFFQIDQLVALITSEFAEEGWAHALEEANHTDRFPLARFLQAPLDKEETTLRLNESVGIAASTPGGDVLVRVGGDDLEEPYEVMKVVSVNVDERTIEVERGQDVAGSPEMEHEEGAQVYQGPLAPGTTITGNPDAQGYPPCGQKPAVVEPTGDAGGGDGGPTVSLNAGATILMGDNFFELDGEQNPTFSLTVGNAAGVTIQNNGSAVHNMRTTGPDGDFDTSDDAVSSPFQVAAEATGQIEFLFPAPGTYGYRCDFHPTEMSGEVAVQ